MKLLAVLTILLTMSACADLSMYNQVPAPIGRSGQATTYPSETSQGVKTYPIDEQISQGDSYASPSDVPTGVQNPAVIALLDSAYQQSESGQLDIAASKLERAVRIDPKDAQVWHALAAIRYQQNKHALAISLAKKSNVLSATNKNLQRSNWMLIAACHEKLGHVNPAERARANASRLF
ncbi:MAG: hypothetical protein ABGX33_06520 [Cycloclasticus sp.]